MSKKRKIPPAFVTEAEGKINREYVADSCSSQTEFIEKAVLKNFSFYNTAFCLQISP